MKLVMTQSYVCSDGKAERERRVFCVEYGSPGHAIAEFERAATIAYWERHTFMFAGREWYPHEFFSFSGTLKFYAPTFQTLEEWHNEGQKHGNDRGSFDS